MAGEELFGPAPLDFARQASPEPDVDAGLPEWWLQIAVWVDNVWQGQFDAHRSVAYFSVLGGLEPDVIRTAFGLAIAEGARTGWDGLPSAAKIFELATRDYSLPGFETAWPAVVDVLRHHHRLGDRHLSAVAQAELETTHPMLVAFVREQGVSHLLGAQVDHEVWGAKVRADLAKAYGECAERYRERRGQLAAIDTMPELRGRKTPHGLAGTLERLREQLAMGTNGGTAQLERGRDAEA